MIQNILPYLPYKLQAEMLDYKIDYTGKQYDTIKGLYLLADEWHCETQGGSRPNINKIVPILKPFEDLTNEKISLLFGYEEHDIVDFDLRRNPIYTEDWYIEFNLFGAPSLTLIAGYKQVQSLFKEHYDLFELIDNKKAKSIHDLPTE